MPVTRKSVLRKLHETCRVRSQHGENGEYGEYGEYGVVLLCLRGCPYSKEAADTLFKHIPLRKVLWISSRLHPLFEMCKKTFKQQTYPICLALPTTHYSASFIRKLSLCSPDDFWQARPPHIVRLGGLSDCTLENVHS